MIASALLPLALLFAPVPGGDEKNPAVEACAGKAEGAPCTHERVTQNAAGKAEMKTEPGFCQPDECCALDYSSGSPPKTTCNACLACKPGAPPTATTTEPTDATAAEPPRSSDDGTPPTVSPNEKRGCSVGHGGAAGWALLALVLGAARRRRR